MSETIARFVEEQRDSLGMVAGSSRRISVYLENRTDRDCVILELGDRSEGDEVNYPADDIQAVLGSDGKWRLNR
jgi:uncharacterized cupin superfamily protein